MLCPQCNFQNAEASPYCERCGTYLQPATVLAQTYTQPSIPPPPPPLREYNPTPSYSFPGQSNLYSQQNVVYPPSKITGFNVLRRIVYFLAIFIAAVGLYGTMYFLIIVPGFRSAGAIVGVVLGLCLFVGGLVIFRTLRHRVPHLRWWLYLVALFAATGVLLLSLTSSALTSPGRLPSILIGVVILLFGLVVAAISFW
jgi:amino acid transporter